jgi:TolA-binding protein
MIRALTLSLLAIPTVVAAQQADSSTRVATTRSMTDTTARAVARVVLPAVEQASDSAPPDSIFVRAQRLIAQGHGEAGRALVQAQLDAAPAGSPAYVKALYWHALVASSASVAEHDLQRIVIEFPLTPQSADALLRLAQLEMARGNRRLALEHLDRLLLEHPHHPSAGRASFWMGRLLFKDDRPAAACVRLAAAARMTPASDVELLNQIDYYQQRCVGVDTSLAHADTALTAQHAPAAPPPVPARETGIDSTPGSRDIPPVARDTQPPARDTAAPPAAATPVYRAHTGRYSVQVAAYNTRALADRLAAGLVAKGLEARVDAGKRYYRVRIGHYATRRAAAEAARKLKARHIDGFVTTVDVP